MTVTTILSFSAVAFMMALSPGPNMIYLISRSICQGRKAGLISLMGISASFFFYMICSALGITTLFISIPILFEFLKISGAGYLFYLAWNALKPGGDTPFKIRELSYDTPTALFKTGFLTNLLNPKILVMYVSLLPQFISPADASVSSQFLILGIIQIIIGTAVNGVIAISAGTISSILITHTSWLLIQRWCFGCILIIVGMHLLISFPVTL